MKGYRPRTQQEFFETVGFWQDRADAVERQREKAAAEPLRKPAEPRFDKWESKANVQAAEDDREVTPASKADLRELEGQVTGLKSAIHALKHGKRGKR